MLDFFIIGGQKSGSTFVQSILRQHPDVLLPRAEIPIFEDPEYLNEHPAAALNRLFPEPDNKRVGIKRPHALSSGQTCRRLAQHYPECRLIAILRDPVDRAISAYFHYVRSGFLPPRAPDEGIARILHGADAESWPRAQEVLEFGLYGKHLEQYYSTFASDQIFVYSFESIMRDNFSFARQLCDFLGLEYALTAQHFAVRPQKTVRTRWRLAYLHQVNRRTAIHYAAYRRAYPSSRPLHRALRILVNQLDKRVIEHVPGQRKLTVSQSTQAALRDYYADDVERLRNLAPGVVAHWPNFQASHERG